MACKQRRSAHKLNSSTQLAPPVSRYQMSKHAHVCLPTDGVRPTAALHAAAADSERTTCIADVPETMCTNFVILELSSFKLLLLLCWSLEYNVIIMCQTWIASIEDWPVFSWLVHDIHVSSLPCKGMYGQRFHMWSSNKFINVASCRLSKLTAGLALFSSLPPIIYNAS